MDPNMEMTTEFINEIVETSSPEQITELINLVTQSNDYLMYICGFILFGVICVVCKYVYKFFNMFF